MKNKKEELTAIGNLLAHRNGIECMEGVFYEIGKKDYTILKDITTNCTYDFSFNYNGEELHSTGRISIPLLRIGDKYYAQCLNEDELKALYSQISVWKGMRK